MTAHCYACNRFKDKASGVLFKDANGRSRWICLGCHEAKVNALKKVKAPKSAEMQS